MNILIFGAGVIGITYAWQLSEAGNQITLLVRKGKKEHFQQNGIAIDCLDTRNRKWVEHQTIFRPKIVDEINFQNAYDLIIVAVNSNQIRPILPILKETAGKTDIMFFSNNWSGMDDISSVLDSSSYFFGYPFKAGGGRDEKGLQTIIFGTSFTNTMVGELDGTTSPRVKRIYQALKKARMNPVISRDIRGYLWAHYVWATASVAAYMNAGSYDRFANNSTELRHCYLAMREGFEVCRKRGVDPAKIIPTSFYYLPLFLLVPFTQLLYQRKDMKRMFEGHILHSLQEMHDMYFELRDSAHHMNISMPYFNRYLPAVERFIQERQNR